MPLLSKILKQLNSAGYEATIGLEVHVQLNTATKIFSSDANGSDAEPNRNVSVISLGHPGTLPVLNESAVEKAVMMGLACGCEITRNGHFARKSYFYPDLPKGYQTTQDKTPICVGGKVAAYGENLIQDAVELHHIHLEEDAGKSVHDDGPDTLIDLNRAGSPLIEIVTEPSIKSAEVAAAFLQEVRRMVRYLEISEANMEKGELRCDANISIKKIEGTALGNKVEIKNMNSFAHVRKAINYELERQLKMAEAGEEIAVETRTFDPAQGKTYGMRFKETMNDYRYFPCPDLPPAVITDEYLEATKNDMEVTPAAMRTFFESAKLNLQDVALLTEEKELALYAKQAVEATGNAKAVANWLNGPIRALMNEKGLSINELSVSVAHLAELIQLVEDGKVVYQTAVQQLLPELQSKQEAPAKLAKAMNLMVAEDSSELETIIDEVLISLPKEVEAFRNGKKKLMGLFMGEVMKKSRGKANPKQVQPLLQQKLNEKK